MDKFGFLPFVREFKITRNWIWRGDPARLVGRSILRRTISAFGRPQTSLQEMERFLGGARGQSNAHSTLRSPLRGRLTTTRFARVDLLEEMIRLFKGIRFHCADLSMWAGSSAGHTLTRKYWEACDCIQPIRVMSNSLGARTSPADSSVAISSLQGFGLSWNRSLRALEIATCLIHRSKWITPSGLTFPQASALSSVASPAYIEVVIVYWNYDVFGVPSAFGGRTVPPSRSLTEARGVEETSRSLRVMEVFLKVHEVCGFQLVLCANVWERVGGYAVRTVKEALPAGRASGGFDISSEPVVNRYSEGPITPPERGFTGRTAQIYEPCCKNDRD